MLRKSALLTVLVTVLAIGAFATPASAEQGTTLHTSCSTGGHLLTVNIHYYEYYGPGLTRNFDYITYTISGSAAGNHNNFHAKFWQPGGTINFEYTSTDDRLPNTEYRVDILPGFTASPQSWTYFSADAIFDEPFAPDPSCTTPPTFAIPPRPASPLSLSNPGTPTNTVNTAVSVQMYASGGYTPYRFTSTALPTGLSLNASTGVISGTPTNVGTTNVTVTVTDYYTYTASTTFNWAINPPPPPPLTLSISGPGTITGKGTYTYSAVYSGFNANPGFAWSERFCYDQASTNCSSWVGLGAGASFTRTLNQDCSGIGENSYQLALTMTNSDGRTASANFTSYLCEVA